MKRCNSSFSPDITIWKSHAVTIVFCTLVGTIAAHFASSRYLVRCQQLDEEITGRQAAEAARRLNEFRLETLLQLNQMTGATLHEITTFALEEAVRLTQSNIGYVAFMNEDETVLTMHAWSRLAMQECRIDDKPLGYAIETTGLWGEAVRSVDLLSPMIIKPPTRLNVAFPKAMWQYFGI